MKYLYIPSGVKAQLRAMRWGNPAAGDGTVSDRTLEAALKFKTNSPLARTLRAAAIQRGGVIYDSTAKGAGYVPDCCSHSDRRTGNWTFVFAGRTTLIYHQADHIVEIAANGEPARIFTGIRTIPQLLELQYLAERIAGLSCGDDSSNA